VPQIRRWQSLKHTQTQRHEITENTLFQHMHGRILLGHCYNLCSYVDFQSSSTRTSLFGTNVHIARGRIKFLQKLIKVNRGVLNWTPGQKEQRKETRRSWNVGQTLRQDPRIVLQEGRKKIMNESMKDLFVNLILWMLLWWKISKSIRWWNVSLNNFIIYFIILQSE